MTFNLALFFFFLSRGSASDGQDVARLGTLGEQDLAVHLHVDENMQELQTSEFTWICIFLKLRPEEDAPNFILQGVVKHPWRLPEKFNSQQQRCNARGGVYARVDQLKQFVNNATSEAPEKIMKSSVAGDTSCKADSAPRETELERAVANWNDRFFNMDKPDSRRHTDLYHARGSEYRHLAMEVSLFKPPKELANRLRERLLNNSDSFFATDGAGKAGTTGASFIAGNVGFGNRGQGANLMDLLFPKQWDHRVEEVQNDGDYKTGAQDDRRTLAGEATTSSVEDDTASLDLRAYEQVMKETIMARSDVHYLYGDIEDVDFQFQHRLWRFGPKFDAKAKGGIWHKDTCPFGVNGALPKDAIMFTLVYIIYTENLNLPTAGTRVRDPRGKIFQLPCEAGMGNMIRSGEDDANAFYHSGPLNIKSADFSKPAYRVMMQSKTVVTPKGGRKKTIPQKGHWRGLGIEQLTIDEGAPADNMTQQLAKWLRSSSEAITYGIGESNAVGSAAYPLNVHRAWSVARDLSSYLGFQTDGFLPAADKIQTPVVMFGFDHYSYTVLEMLESSGFRVSTIASEKMYEQFYKVYQDSYANMNTMDIHRKQGVQALFDNEPFDMHVVVDVAPGAFQVPGAQKYKDPVLASYEDLLKRIASRPRGEGSLATVTYLSEMSPGKNKEDVLAAEQEWKRFGDDNQVRIVIMRVADRVYGKNNLAHLLDHKKDNELYIASICRRKECTKEQPVTRIHSEDLAGIVTRMLSMFDMVETHGEDSSMQKSASLDSSLARFPSGIVLNLVDGASADSMAEAEVWVKLMTGDISLSDAGKEIAKRLPQFPDPPSDFDADANGVLKAKLAYEFKYPSYRHGAAKLFGLREHL